MITELRYITIVVKDIETSLAWYTEKMGFEKRMDIKKPGSRWVTIGVHGPKVARDYSPVSFSG